MKKAEVAIIMGSDSDLEVMSSAAELLEKLEIPYVMDVLSAHRSPAETADFAQKAKSIGIKVIIAAAGGAAALPGVAAALTTLPVIGVPIKSKSLEGLDSLLSMVQMPPGVPVATVGINGAHNAAILAAQILALSDSGVSQKLEEYKRSMVKGVREKSQKLKTEGYKKYLNQKK
jgi:5-(carboxyamino)imidazole ribonucleotide mutase